MRDFQSPGTFSSRIALTDCNNLSKTITAWSSVRCSETYENCSRTALGTSHIMFEGSWRSIDRSNISIISHDGYAISQDILLKIAEWLAYHNKRGEKILAHCNLGRGRAALAIVAYLAYMGVTPRSIERFVNSFLFIRGIVINI